MSAAPARRCAYAVLRRVFEQQAYADQALHSASRGLDARDHALAMRLAYGAVQRRLTLDYAIERLAGRPAERLDAAVLAALRVGLYELYYLRGAPDRAVVADTVELAKEAGSRGYGLVNAVMRRAAREGAGSLFASFGEDTPESAAVMHSHPPWLAQMWWRELGAERTRALMRADNEPGELALRVNTLRAGTRADAKAGTDADTGAVAAKLGVSTHGDPELPEALVVQAPLDLHRTAVWQEGGVLAQSRAAMLVARALDPQAGERVLDLCAAPGGKSTHLAALMGGEGEVVAVERNPARAEQLRETARRLGAASVTVEVLDAALPRPDGDRFDRVLVDPPCSGLGTLQARPDLRWRATPERIAELAALQRKILAAGAEALRPGGTLVYSTCTISAVENEQLIEQFLSENSAFTIEDLTSQWPAYAHPRAEHFLLTLPDRDRTAGFFIARMRRVAG
ncbi:MAG TPA: 16S rRNA (cytosine(967)-C(5))-methyltransferase RsmB [Solirubrobacteraceae bacterium]|nr:16S rRNA (cytosine(967)-C(5))-methyltransferase RsmB [Solirubrobacteraceae bacterium]